MAKKKSLSLGYNLLIILLLLLIGSIAIDSFDIPLFKTEGNYSLPSNYNVDYTYTNPYRDITDSSEINLDDNFNYDVLFCPEDKCAEKLEVMVKDSNRVYCSVYEINLNSFYNLILDKEDVKIVTDDKQLAKVIEEDENIANIVNVLEREGKLVTDTKDYDYMHNKFCLFDKTLWIGSFNFTYNAKEYNNNNVIITDNNYLYSLALEEFEEQFSGVFGKGAKTPTQENYPKIYFCPEDDCISKYIETLDLAKSSVWCMFFSNTYESIGNKFIELDERGINQKFIFDKMNAGSRYSIYHDLEDKGIDLIKDNNPKIMHNKFCIIDSRYVITGSMNPSKHSQDDNDESILIINNKEIANSYSNYFRKYWGQWS